ncbi:26009_t:CDS:2, partial [Gigaspora margarita]
AVSRVGNGAPKKIPMDIVHWYLLSHILAHWPPLHRPIMWKHLNQNSVNLCGHNA